MIDYIQIYKKTRGYMYLGEDKEYTGKYLRLSELVKRTECVVSKPTLSQRLTCGINESTVHCWTDIMQCLTTPEKMGNHKYIYRDTSNKMQEVDTYFIDLMMSMKVNAYKPLIMQSKPIEEIKR